MPSEGAGIRVRAFADTDADAVAQVMFRSVRQGATSDYSEEQVRAWMPEPPPRERVLQWAGSGRTLLVAVRDDGELVGWGDVEPGGHVDHLFCAPEVIGQGVGSVLLAGLEESAAAAGVERMTVHASELARRLFAARGYAVDVHQQVERGGVVLHNYAMHKDL